MEIEKAARLRNSGDERRSPNPCRRRYGYGYGYGYGYIHHRHGNVSSSRRNNSPTVFFFTPRRKHLASILNRFIPLRVEEIHHEERESERNLRSRCIFRRANSILLNPAYKNAAFEIKTKPLLPVWDL